MAWKNSSAGFFVSTDGGKTWSYGWEANGTAVRTAILLEQTLKELDDRYKKAKELSDELLLELDNRYQTATAISVELQNALDKRYETAKKLSQDLYEELDEKYGTASSLSAQLQNLLDERYHQKIPVEETAPDAPAKDSLWVDKENLRLKLWDGENWQTIGYEPAQTNPEEPDTGNKDTDGAEEGGS